MKTTVISIILILLCTSILASTYYVAANGSNTNPGTISRPFLTIQRAQDAVTAGDTVFIRGGTFVMNESQIAQRQRIWVYVTELNKSGAEGKRINYWAYPGEHPVFDYTDIKPANYRITAFYVSGSWIHIKGLEVVGVQVTITGHTQSECFENQGSNNIYEMLKMHDGQAIGFYLLKGSDNLILNCDAYRNYDSISENRKGGNTDGFGNHPAKGSVHNVFRGCRAWFNSDDGYDCIGAYEQTVFENCWSFYNGYSTSFAGLGDGNGFKAGGYGSHPVSDLPDPVPRNIIRFCLAVRNKANGFYSNHHIQGSDWINNTAYLNTVNYNMLNRQPDNVTDVPGYNHLLRNNLGYQARSAELLNINIKKSDTLHNYFSLPAPVTAADFVSLDEALLTAPRQADGSLPNTDFMKLKPISRLVNKGADIGFPFKGAAPDLGCFETAGALQLESPVPVTDLLLRLLFRRRIAEQ